MLRESFPVGPLQCNCTVLGDAESREAVVIDPGGDVNRILAVLAKHRLTLKSVVVTHAHLDHIAGAQQLKAATGSPILYHQGDLALVALMDQQAAWMGVPTPVVLPPDVALNDGDSIPVGSAKLQVLHTPGHTPGSISLYAPDASLLVAGDTLFRGAVGRTDLWYGNAVHLLRSIHDKLLHLPGSTEVSAGHGQATTIEREQELNPFLRNV